jgi:hypothetical protein
METVNKNDVIQLVTEIRYRQRETHQYPAHLCILRNGTGCPFRRLQQPNCHECHKAELDHDKLQTYLAENGFTFHSAKTESDNKRRVTIMTSDRGTLFINSSGTLGVGSHHGGFSMIYVPAN